MKQKGLAPVLIIILIAALAVGGYLVYNFVGFCGKNCINEKGVFADSALSQQTPQPTSIPSSTPSSTADSSTSAETVNWKTYLNQQYNYQIKYPSNWKVDREDKDKPAFKSLVQLSQTNPKTLYNFVVIISPKTYAALLNNLKDNLSRDNGTVTTYKLNDQISAQKAIITTGAGKSDYLVDIIFEQNNLVFDISASFINPPNQIELDQFNQILSTFKFTP